MIDDSAKLQGCPLETEKGGWQDFKTFQIYVRMAGIEVAGATEGLSVLPPKPNEQNVFYFKN